MKYSIVIPCYNEENNLKHLIKRLIEYRQGKDIEYVLVENGSTDSSYNILLELTEQVSYIKVVKVDINQGYGYGLGQGILAASGEYVGWLHADLQVSLEDMNVFFDYLEHNNYPEKIMLKGTRHNRSFVEYFFTWGMAIFETLLFLKPLYDISAIPVLFHHKLVEDMRNMPNGFEIELYAYYKAKKNRYDLVRFPIKMQERVNGKSSWNTGFVSRIKQSWRIIKASFEIVR